MKCFQLALAAKNWSNGAENHWRRQMRIFRMFSLDCPRWTCEIDPSFLPNVPFVDRAAKTSIPMTFYNPVSFLIQNRVTKLSMLSLVFSRFPTSSNCLWSNDKRWWYSPHHHSRQSGAQSTFCKWLSLHTNTHRHALTHAQTMTCLWGYYLRVSSGRSWVHHTTLGPYLSRRHGLISIPLPALTSVPIAPRHGD